VILLQVDAVCVAVLKLERDAPGAIHMNGVPDRPKSSEHVKVEPWMVEIDRTSSYIQPIETKQKAFAQPSVDFCGSSCGP
jgi:hypothetical protein